MAETDKTPVLVLGAAFLYLDNFDLLLTVPKVNKAWKQASESQELWGFAILRDFFALDFEGNEGETMDRKRYIKLLRLVKNPESLFRMQQSSLAVYSLDENTLTQREDDRFASSGRFCVTASGTLVITGGKQNEGRNCYLYTPVSNAFSVLPPMREHREYHGMCLWNASIVVSGGYEMQSEQSEVYTNTAEQLWNGIWRPLAPMLHPRAYHTLVPAEHQLFAVAGMNAEVGYLDSIECWEFDYWRLLPVTLPEAISDPTAKFVFPNTILVLGGMHEFGFLDSAVEVDLEMNSTKTYKLPVEVYTGNNCITRRGNQLIVLNTLKEVVKLRYERGVRVEGLII